ncbi:internalin protein [Reticulomyxa filosa]|uniref:Internalin protein n=1 Tax=Reticulomyxa filosa TaxID=46433 RepID=X6P7N8_RETFI|nr:internalin protein [Reticulomyxa filosa]|eukprot:ETO34133.1 internalin protein [Reticulomyxa filosa]
MAFEQTTKEGEKNEEGSADSVADVGALLNLSNLSAEHKKAILEAFEKSRQPKTVVITVEEDEKMKAMEKKMEDLRQKEKEVKETIKKVKEKGEQSKSKINEEIEKLIEKIIKRKKELIALVDSTVSTKLQMMQSLLSVLDKSFQSLQNTYTYVVIRTYSIRTMFEKYGIAQPWIYRCESSR